MIDREFAEDFSRKWIEAFNSHDLDRIFEFYDDDFTMTSPYIKERMGIDSGALRGKEKIRPYWERSLSLSPPLKFELTGVYIGVSTVIVHYTNIGRKMVCETFTFNDSGKVITGCSQHGQAL